MSPAPAALIFKPLPVELRSGESPPFLESSITTWRFRHPQVRPTLVLSLALSRESLVFDLHLGSRGPRIRLRMASPYSVASVLLIFLGAFAWAESRRGSCPVEPFPFLYGLMSRCSTWVSPGLPLQVRCFFALDSDGSLRHVSGCAESLLLYGLCGCFVPLGVFFDGFFFLFPSWLVINSLIISFGCRK